MSFSTEYPAVLIFLCLAFAWILSRLIYPGNNIINPIPVWKLYLLRVLRAGIIFIISVLLLSPVVKIKHIKNEIPHLIVLSDNSYSMINGKDSAKIVADVSGLRDKIFNVLGNSFKIKWISFDNEIGDDKELAFNGQNSNYSEALSQVYKKFNFLQPSALILIGDGLYNLGENPAGIAKSLDFPVYSIPFGDTVPKTDISILNTRTKPVVFKGANFQAEVEIVGKELPLADAEVKIFYNDKLLYNRTLKINKKTFYSNEKFILNAPDSGILNYKISVSEVKGETNLENNSKIITVESIENRQKVLIISEGPHPDIGAVKHSLDIAGYETYLVQNGNYSNIKPEDYNLLLIFQLPAEGKINQQEDIGRFFNSNIPRWVFVTGDTNLEEFNSYNTGLKIVPQEGKSVELPVVVNEEFDHFSIEDEFSELASVLPPVFAPKGKCYLNNDGMQILMKHSANGDISDYPVLSVGINNHVKTAITVGEGIWRWRMREAQSAGSSRLFNKLISKIANYLSLKNNWDNFNIEYARVLDSFDPVIFKAEVIDDVNEFVHNAEIEFEIQNETGEVYECVFDERDNVYELDAGNFPPGKYTFIASVETGTRKYNEKGSFEIKDNNLEKLYTTANHKILYQISDITGGDVYYPDESDKMIERILKLKEEKSNKTIEENVIDFIHIKYILFMIVIIASTEWLLRRYWGSY